MCHRTHDFSLYCVTLLLSQWADSKDRVRDELVIVRGQSAGAWSEGKRKKNIDLLKPVKMFKRAWNTTRSCRKRESSVTGLSHDIFSLVSRLQLSIDAM